MYSRLIQFALLGIFFVAAVYRYTAYSVSVDDTACSSNKDGKTAICKVQGVDSAITSQFACTNQMDSIWNCVEITPTRDHLNGIKDTLKKLLDLKIQANDVIKNFGRLSPQLSVINYLLDKSKTYSSLVLSIPKILI
ncbi:MAG TPA: hypothetical protein VJS91_06400 [Nitrososphaeraceae archaeon]|nr:hypothetical protein [Nitrososphaeraceae archaeon]